MSQRKPELSRKKRRNPLKLKGICQVVVAYGGFEEVAKPYKNLMLRGGPTQVLIAITLFSLEQKKTASRTAHITNLSR